MVGATLPHEAPVWRRSLPRAWFLVPGFGAQGATVDDVRGHFLPDGSGALVTASRSVLFPAEGREAPEAMVEGIRGRALALVEQLRRS